MKVLITGANGFAGSWLVRRLLEDGHEVVGAEGTTHDAAILSPEERAQVEWHTLDLADGESVAALGAIGANAVVHLGALSSVAETTRDPVRGWTVNTLGTVRLLDTLLRARDGGGPDPVVLVVSTGEVYGPGPERPRSETEPVAPCSPYAATKAAAELAALEVWRRTELRVIVARSFPHTGPGQSDRFVTPAFAARLLEAARTGAKTVRTGRLDPVRDLADVRDVVRAYTLLITSGEPGLVYNVGSGSGLRVMELFDRIAALTGHRPTPELDPKLARAVDIPHLVGDVTRLRSATGWKPQFTIDQTLRDVLDAQTH